MFNLYLIPLIYMATTVFIKTKINTIQIVALSTVKMIAMSIICAISIIFMGVMYTSISLYSKKLNNIIGNILNIQTGISTSVLLVAFKYYLYMNSKQINYFNYMLLIISLHAPYYITIIHHSGYQFMSSLKHISMSKVSNFKKILLLHKKHISPFACLLLTDIINDSSIMMFDQRIFNKINSFQELNIHNMIVSFVIIKIYTRYYKVNTK